MISPHLSSGTHILTSTGKLDAVIVPQIGVAADVHSAFVEHSSPLPLATSAASSSSSSSSATSAD